MSIRHGEEVKGGGSQRRSGRFTSGRETRYPLYKMMNGSGKFSLNGVRTADPPALSELRRRLRYPAPVEVQ